MKKLLILLTGFYVVFGKVDALLPPLFQTANEIKSILSDDQFSQFLHAGEVIISIQKSGKGYEIKTNKHRLQVDVAYETNDRPGPALFKFKFHEPIALF